MINYIWQAGDELWLVAARFLAQSGSTTTAQLVDLMQQANAQVGPGQPTLIYDWLTIVPGTVVLIPISQIQTN